jgi:hypothetical protein
MTKKSTNERDAEMSEVITESRKKVQSPGKLSKSLDTTTQTLVMPLINKISDAQRKYNKYTAIILIVKCKFNQLSNCQLSNTGKSFKNKINKKTGFQYNICMFFKLVLISNNLKLVASFSSKLKLV